MGASRSFNHSAIDIHTIGQKPIAWKNEKVQLDLDETTIPLTAAFTLCRLASMNQQETPRLSYQGLLVLRAFLDHQRKELCGADLLKITNLSSGTLYPILLRFEKYSLLESDWEDAAPKEVGRPRRRLYKITPHGAQSARQLLANVTQPRRNPVLVGGS